MPAKRCSNILVIAYEFGFTDESHFNKFFRKQKGYSPSEFRKTIRLSA
ncbi:helix-turn-helix domain-containing protein [Flavobacterium sp. RS13.1]